MVNATVSQSVSVMSSLPAPNGDFRSAGAAALLCALSVFWFFVIAMAFQSQYASALAYNLAQVSPGDLDMVFLGSSGSEAMEAALAVGGK